MDRTDTAPRGSQSKLSPVLFWVVLAALLFRLVTIATDRNRKKGSAGLVQWQPHETALAVSGKTGRPVLYDFTAAWCAPCHRLDTEAWGDSEIAGTVNSGFVPARVVDRQEEEGHNAPAVEALQKLYRVEAFPTLVIADSSGREIARSEGFRGREAIHRFLKDAKSAAGASVAKP
jgi:thiol-disulfide isomerase/thioredoxin